MKIDISLVIPLLDEAESLPELTQWISRVMETHGFTYEIVFIDDGSRDNSWEVITQLSTTHPQIRAISFVRNYGKSAALHVGFRLAKGEVVCTMDADLQDSPDEIPELYRMIKEDGYDLVSGWKKKRHDPLSKTIPTKLYNFATQVASGIQLHDFNCGLKAYRQKVVKTIEVYGEMHRYIPVIAKWEGFTRIGEKVVTHYPRKYGSTKFGLERFVNGFLDLLSISFVARFKKKPMHFFGALGSLFFLFGFGAAAFILLEKLYFANFLAKMPPRDVVQQPLFFLSLTAVIIGVQLFMAGFLAELVSRASATRNEYHIEKEL